MIDRRDSTDTPPNIDVPIGETVVAPRVRAMGTVAPADVALAPEPEEDPSLVAWDPEAIERTGAEGERAAELAAEAARLAKEAEAEHRSSSTLFSEAEARRKSRTTRT